jgi:uncharacterized protein
VVPLAAERLQHDEEEHRATEAASEKEIEGSPAGSQDGGSGHESFVDHGVSLARCLHELAAVPRQIPLEQTACQRDSRNPAASAAASELGRRHLASAWHTVALASVIVAVAVTGMLLTRANGGGLPIGPTVSPAVAYLPTVGVAWGMALYVCRLGRAKSELVSLLGRPWRTALDLPLSLGVVASIFTLQMLLSHVFPGAAPSSIALPHTPATRIVWVVLAASVGLSEELVYRGYFIVQGEWLLGGVVRAVVAQAMLFGLAHADQGVGGVVRAAAYGVVFGIVAVMRRSLWPGIVAHIGIDLIAGIAPS